MPKKPKKPAKSNPHTETWWRVLKTTHVSNKVYLDPNIFVTKTDALQAAREMSRRWVNAFGSRPPKCRVVRVRETVIEAKERKR